MKRREIRSSISQSTWKKICLFSAVLWGTSVAAFGNSPTIVNADFSAVPIVCGGGYSYQSLGGDCNSIPPQQDFNSAPGFGWTFVTAGGSGLAGPNGFDTPSFSGLPFNQSVFLQGNGNPIDQTMGFTTAGSYVLTFYLGSRYRGGLTDGSQTVEVLIDSTPIGTWSLTSFTPFTLENAQFTVVAGGPHTLEFVGLASGDHTAFFSGVSITQPIPEPSSIALLMGPALLGFRAFKRR